MGGMKNLIKLNDYLYNGDTVLKILHNYSQDLKKSAQETGNEIDLVHCDYLMGMTSLLEHNDFLTSQAQRIREFYKFMAEEYPYLAFTFKGRIKSLVRSEEKFNRNLVEKIDEAYAETGKIPTPDELRERVTAVRDLIAYRIIISMPACHLKNREDKEVIEEKILYAIAEELRDFLEQRGFTAETSDFAKKKPSTKISNRNKPYFKDYLENPTPLGYRSLHIVAFDNVSQNYVELQLRNQKMDDMAEIGRANHTTYEEYQQREAKRVPVGLCKYYDDAYERLVALQNLDLAKVDVNLFTAANNTLINDGCGFYRGRLIMPFEHLSRFQNDLID